MKELPASAALLSDLGGNGAMTEDDWRLLDKQVRQFILSTSASIIQRGKSRNTHRNGVSRYHQSLN